MRMNACLRCGGAAYLDNPDEEEWRCLQCGRLVPVPSESTKRETVRAA
jgi:hypothetical protein